MANVHGMTRGSPGERESSHDRIHKPPTSLPRPRHHDPLHRPGSDGQFYRTILGGEIVPTDGGLQRRYRFGTWELILLPNAEAVSPATFPTHAMPLFWLEVVDLPAAVTWLTREQVTIVDPGDDQSLMIADPDGIVIEVWARVSES